MTQDLQQQFSEAAMELNLQLDKAFTVIREHKLGVPALINADGYEVGLDKVRGQWQFYYAEDGMKKAMHSAPILARIALANNLEALWGQILLNYGAKREAIIEAARKAADFCSAMEAQDDSV